MIRTIFMKNIYIVFTIVILYSICSCDDSVESSAKSKHANDTSSLLKANADETGNRINYDSMKVLERVYVIDRSGIEIKQQTDDNSKTLGTYNYGDQLKVVEINDHWLGIADRVTRITINKNGNNVETTQWEKVYIRKELTGKLTDIQLIKQDLYTINLLSIHGKLENTNSLNNYLSLELINQSEYASKKGTSTDFLIRDTALIKKKNGILELECLKKNKKYTDNIDGIGEAYSEYNYLGRFDFLNKYIIYGGYYENHDYKLIDITSGEEQTLGDYPYISVDKKQLICIELNPFDWTATLQVYAINGKQIKLTTSATFTNWMPTLNIENIFWSSDGFLYVPVVHTKTYSNEEGMPNKNYQYVRIKVL